MTAAPSAMWGSVSGNKTMANAPSVATAMRKLSSKALPRSRLLQALASTSWPAITKGTRNSAKLAYTQPGSPNAARRTPSSSRAKTTAKIASAMRIRLRLCSSDSFFLRFFFFASLMAVHLQKF